MLSVRIERQCSREVVSRAVTYACWGNGNESIFIISMIGLFAWDRLRVDANLPVSIAV